jgi:hypothetical protein
MQKKERLKLIPDIAHSCKKIVHMKKQKTENLKIQFKDGSIVNGEIYYFRQQITPYKWTIEFTASIFDKVEFTSGDMFECLTMLRKELVKYNCLLLCNGARLDVYPSGMCRDMGDGLVAYVSKPGEIVREEDLVYIFDYAEPELIASVEEQYNFHVSRINSKLHNPKVLKIQHNNGSIIEGEIIQYIGAKPCKIKFTSSVTIDIECININYFECLIDFRKKLADLYYRTLCNGARLDSYVFPKDLQMVNGDMVFLLNHREIPDEHDWVSIFDYAEAKSIASIEDQKKYYESWLDSIKSIPFSAYGDYGTYKFPELYFRLVKIGDLPLMWIFEIEDESQKKRSRALSLISPEQVEKIGSLKGEAIIGFITGKSLSIDNFTSNRVCKDFIQKVIAAEAPKDRELQTAALEQQAGWLYIIDNRVADLERAETSPEDILGVFEIKDGRIVANSYQPNENYLIFGNNGLMQLPASLHKSLIKALESLSD